MVRRGNEVSGRRAGTGALRTAAQRFANVSAVIVVDASGAWRPDVCSGERFDGGFEAPRGFDEFGRVEGRERQSQVLA